MFRLRSSFRAPCLVFVCLSACLVRPSVLCRRSIFDSLVFPVDTHEDLFLAARFHLERDSELYRNSLCARAQSVLEACCFVDLFLRANARVRASVLCMARAQRAFLRAARRSAMASARAQCARSARRAHARPARTFERC